MPQITVVQPSVRDGPDGRPLCDLLDLGLCVVKERATHVELYQSTKRIVTGWVNSEVVFPEADERYTREHGCVSDVSSSCVRVLVLRLCVHPGSFLVFPMSFNHLQSSRATIDGVVRSPRRAVPGPPQASRVYRVLSLAGQMNAIEVHSAKPVIVEVVERPVSLFVSAVIERAIARGTCRNVCASLSFSLTTCMHGPKHGCASHPLPLLRCFRTLPCGRTSCATTLARPLLQKTAAATSSSRLFCSAPAAST